jgi:hypothetical protein
MEKPKPQNIENFKELRYEKSWWGYKNQEEYLENYISISSKLTNSIQNFDTVDGEPKPADIVVYLDKSARPVSWFVNELWPLIAKKDEHGVVSPKPETKFANIDRLPWRKDRNVSIVEHPENMIEPTVEDIEGLRAIFLKRPAREGEEVSKVRSFLDGKRVLIVDEINDSGDTMRVAQTLFEMAFPDAVFKTMAWMNRYGINPDGSKKVLERPTFYDEKNPAVGEHFGEDGRAVFDPDVTYSPVISGKGVHGQVRPGSQFASKKKSLKPGSFQHLSSRPPLMPKPAPERLKDENDEEYQIRLEAIKQAKTAKREKYDRQLARDDLTPKQRRVLNILRDHTEYTTVDQKGLRLRQEIKVVAQKFAHLELIPFVLNFNGDIEAYLAARKNRVRPRG